MLHTLYAEFYVIFILFRAVCCFFYAIYSIFNCVHPYSILTLHHYVILCQTVLYYLTRIDTAFFRFFHLFMMN